jgi:cyclophilin family peptidyl-prolyl cis-trans isomerase
MSKVKISTAKGDMVAELYDNETPITVKNFLDLIENINFIG